MTLGQTLCQWREAQGHSQRDLAKLLGVTQPALCDYEMDRTIPRADTIVKIVQVTRGAITLEMISDAARSKREEQAVRRRERQARTGTHG